jgi:hypothetical protein
VFMLVFVFVLVLMSCSCSCSVVASGLVFCRASETSSQGETVLVEPDSL